MSDAEPAEEPLAAPCRRAVAEALEAIRPAAARATYAVLRGSVSEGDPMAPALRDKRIRKTLLPEEPGSNDGGLGRLSVISCCLLVFTKELTREFERRWGRAGIAQANIIRDAVEALERLDERERKPGAPPGADLDRMDATYYIETAARFCGSIGAGADLAERVRALGRGLRPAGQQPAALPALPEPRGPAGRRMAWFEDEALRARVAGEADAVDPDEVADEIRRRLEEEVSRRSWAGRALVASRPEEVPDLDELAVVVLPFEDVSSGRDPGFLYHDLDRSLEITLNCAEGERRNRNSLAFVAADSRAHRLLEKSARDYLAMCRVRFGSGGGAPDASVAAYAEEADEDVRYTLRRAYCVLIYPARDCTPSEPMFEAVGFDCDNIVDDAVAALNEKGALFIADRGAYAGEEWSSARLLEALDGLESAGMVPGGYISVRDLWDALYSACGMPRLSSQRLLLRSISSCVSENRLAYARSAKWKWGADGSAELSFDWASWGVSMDGFVMGVRDAVARGWSPDVLKADDGRGVYFEREPPDWSMRRLCQAMQDEIRRLIRSYVRRLDIASCSDALLPRHIFSGVRDIPPEETFTLNLRSLSIVTFSRILARRRPSSSVSVRVNS